MKSKNCFWLATLLLISLPAMAQISGPSTVNSGTTHTYSYTQSALVSPNWQVSGGTKIGETYNYANYTVTVTWGAGPSGGVALLDNGMPAATLSVTINQVLVAPVATAATNVTPSSFRLNWNGVAGATEYWADVSTSSSFSTFTTMRDWGAGILSATGLTANTTYYYRVRGATAQGQGPNSNTITVTTPPVAPTASAATAITASSFTANWAATAGATSYRLDVSTDVNFSSFVTNYNNATVGGTSASVTGLSPGTTYYYRVRAVNSASVVSANSSSISALTIPASPVTSAATSITANSFTANWAAATGAVDYRLDVATDLGFTSILSSYNNLTVAGTSASVTGLSAATTYYYRVRATNGTGASSNSSPVTVLTVCAAPTASPATSITGSTFTANWIAAAGATGYYLDICAVSNFSSGVNTQYTTATNYSDWGLTPGGSYYYRVRAVNATGQSANSSTITVLTVSSAPVFTTTTAITTSSFTLNWPAVTGAASYRLDIYTNAGLTSVFSTYNNLSITGTSRVVSGLAAGTNYWCRMRSVNASGTSGNSATLQVISISPAPTAGTPNAITATSFTANWSAATGAASYRLDVSNVSNFASFVSGYNDLTVAGTSLNITGQAMNVNYYYRVRAVNASGASANSSVITLDLDHNYIRRTSLLKSGYTTPAAVDAAPATDKVITFEFYDGLGRPSQTVIKQGSPAGADVVQAMAYDQFGREPIKYLPYADGSSGWFKENALKDPSTGVYTSGKQYQFYQTGGLLANDTKPFAETRFEPSPLNRALEQGAPGLDWQPDATDTYTSGDRTQKRSYQVVTSASEVRLWTYIHPSINSPELFGMIHAGNTPVYYPANVLYRTRYKNEDLNEVIEYVDNSGRTILKRVQAVTSPTNINDTEYASTYYIYDDFGRLACVVPPEASSRISSEFIIQTPSVKEAFLRKWTFRYKYDERGRLIRKQVPGAGPVVMIYDDLDRLVLTQDSVQRAKTPTREWLFMKYDVYGRPVLTGKYLSNNLYTAMKAAVATYYNNLTGSQAWFETYIGSGGAILGYDNKSFPQSTVDADYLTVTYYDKYDTYMAPAGYTYTTQSLVDPETSIAQEAVATINAVRPFGQVTGMQVKNLGTGTWLRTVNYYDQKLRPVQAVGDHQKGKVTVSNIVDFSGKVLYTRRTYIVNSITTYVNENPNYDQFGRLLWTKHSTNGSADVMVAKNEYNELGQPVDKKLHSTDGGTTFKQSVDYRYNIRGWLKKVNEADVSSVAAGDATADYFGMELGYQTALSGVTSTNQFSGNISAIQWSKGDGGTARRQAYAFAYDNMSRLKDANHFDYERIAGVWSWNNNSNGYGENLTYDLNGNIVTLLRKGFKGSSMDNLSYAYSGNQLSYVNDAASATLGFINGNTGTDDYSYDANGNLNRDKNKGFVTAGDIKYNYLNLTEEIRKGANEKVKYIYDAAGRKLAQEVYNTSGTLVKTTDYIGEMVYENNVLKLLQHSEGRVLPDGANWEYQYFLKDHLGNVRITFTAKTQTATNYTTDFEASTNADFQNYNNTTFDLVDHTDAAGTVYQKVQWLNGGVNGRVGLAKSLAVMPGDQVSITAYAKYMNLGTTANPNAFITSLAAAFGVSSGSTGEALKIYNGLNSYATAVPGGDHYQDNASAPKAFVTIIFFDKDYNLIDAAWDQVTTTGAQTSPTVKQPPHDVMSISAKAPEAGYAFVFVSNEHFNYVDVYFDDVTVGHTPSPIVSTSDYFPFGLSYNSMERAGSLEQKYMYNGKELQDEMALNWYDYGARMYMPEIGRWGVVDPLAEKSRRWTPYRYGFDNPVRFIDPDGMFEYSNGYTTTDSRTETGSVSHGGTFQNTASIKLQIVGTHSPEQRKEYNKAIGLINQRLKQLNIKLTASTMSDKKVASKSQFQKQYGEGSAYVIIGDAKELDQASTDAHSSGWEKVDQLAGMYDVGKSASHDNLSFVRTDKANKVQVAYFTQNRAVTDEFKSPSERLSHYVRHEVTHLFYDRGHIDGTIIQEGFQFKSNDIYTPDMIKEYQCNFGKADE